MCTDGVVVGAVASHENDLARVRFRPGVICELKANI